MSERPTPDRDPALDLLRDLDPAATLSSAATARIATRLDALTRPRAKRWLLLGVPLTACAVLFALLSARHSVSHREVMQDVVLPPCAMTRLDDGNHLTAALIGPAHAKLGRHDRQKIVVDEGRLIVRASGVVDVVAPDAIIHVAPSAFADIEVRNLHAVQVAVYAGRATIETSNLSRQLTAGQSWSAGGPRSDAVDSEAASRMMLPGAHQVCPAPVTQHATLPTPPPALARPRIRTLVSREAHPMPPGDRPPIETVPTPVSPPMNVQLLDAAIRKLRRDREPRAALEMLDTLQQQPAMAFDDEVVLLRLEALLRLGEQRKALQLLDASSLDELPRAVELHVLRGDLRATAARCRDAIDDYDRALRDDVASQVERALVGRAVCRMKIGDVAAATADARRYLQQFPGGRFAVEARQMLRGVR